MNLVAFCNPEHGTLCKPFNIGDHTYATNGRVIVRLDDKKHMFEDVEPYYMDNILRMKWSDFSSDQFKSIDLIPLPEVDLSVLNKCSVCDGDAKVSLCPECDGEGVVSFANGHNEYNSTCITCSGNKYVEGDDFPCIECSGTGHDLTKGSQLVGQHRIAIQYLHLLKRLVNVRFFETGDRLSPMEFKFFGGQGIIMPMR